VATIRERKPGVWEVRAFTGRDGGGRPTQVSRTVRGTKNDAKRVAAELTLRPATASARMTMGELLDLWVDQQAALWSPATARDQRSRVGLVKADAIASVPLVRLTAVDVDRWHARLERSDVGEGSLRNQHLVLRAAVTQAVRWGWVTTNVVAVARLGRRKQAPRGAMGEGEVRRVLAAAEELVAEKKIEPAAVVALRLAATTGARRSELAALRWTDLDGDRLTVDSSLAIIRHGDADAPTVPTLRDDPTKTANRRTVTLDRATVELLAELRELHGAYGPWILAVGDRPANPERLSAWWRRARDKAKVDGRWRLHDLRHWSATISIAQGHDIRTVANRLGHANPAMTLRVYAHAVESTDGAVADMLGDVLDGGRGNVEADPEVSITS
jgi:integrase